MFEAPPAEVLMPDPGPAFAISDPQPYQPLRLPRSCEAVPGEVVVCGRREQSRHRLAPIGRAPLPPRDPDMPFGLDLAPNVRLGLGAVDGGLGQGVGVRLRIRF